MGCTLLRRIARGAVMGALSIAVAVASSSSAAEGDLEQLDDVEDRLSRLETLAGNVEVGGWLDFVFKDSEKTGQAPYFDPHHFYLYFDARVSDSWSGFAEIEYEHAPRFEEGEGSGEIKAERLYIQYRHNRKIQLRFGKFNTRSGYWTPEHWTILVDTIQKPIHEDNAYVPAKQVGVEASGQLFSGTAFGLPVAVDAAFWGSNGSEIFATNEPRDDDFGFGSDLRVTFFDNYLLGASFYQQKNPDQTGRTERSVVAYTDLRLPCDLTLRGEFLHQNRNHAFSDVSVGYAKLRWDFFERAYLNYRFGIGDDDKRGTGDTHVEHVATLGYSPHPNVRLRAEYARNEFDATGVEDFNVWAAYLGLIF